MPLEVRSCSHKYFNLLLITAFLTAQGCALAAPAALTYGVSKLSTPKTESAPAPQATELRTYPEYVTAMERINMEREKAGLERRPIMTQEEWVCAQKAGSTPTTAAASPASASAPAPTAAAAAVPAAAATSTPTAPPAETSEKASEAK